AVNCSLPHSCIEPSFARQHRDAVVALRAPTLRDRPGLHNMQRRLLNHGHLTKRIESWAISGAASQLDYRYPLLDRRLLEFCLGIPAHQFYQRGRTRYLLGCAVGTIVPSHLQGRLTKDDPAASEVVEWLATRMLRAVYDQLEPPAHLHPVAAYVDIARLQEGIHRSTDLSTLGLGFQSVYNALQCFAVKHIGGYT
ncbi:MAG: asparagine synthase-related protein, partial [Candidatus Tectomicrobia bacterium]|nr:asparagine synthase-related protein [Candidatus Tectomicrobia bacterium]